LHCEHATVHHVAFLQTNKLVKRLKKEYYINLMAYICFKYVLLPKTHLAVLVIHSYQTENNSWAAELLHIRMRALSVH